MVFEKYAKKEQSGLDILPLLDSLFSLLPMRANIENYELDAGRKKLVEHVARKTIEYNRKSLIAAVRADKYFKGPLAPYDDRAMAVLYVMKDITERPDFRIKTFGVVLGADKEMSLWPGLLMVVYEINPEGIDMRVVPSLGIENENPVIPSGKIRENGLLFTGRPENIEKWRALGFSVEETPNKFQS